MTDEGSLGSRTELTQTQRSEDGIGLSARFVNLVSGAVGAIAGLTPHVLHHIGPLAGSAILTGTEGSVLFGALGFALALPMLVRLRKRFGTWLAPGIAMAVFIAMFAISTLWIGPAIRGDDAAPDTDPHHEARIALLLRVTRSGHNVT